LRVAPSLYGVRRHSVAATALLSARKHRCTRRRFVRAKAVSPLRSATALQNASQAGASQRDGSTFGGNRCVRANVGERVKKWSQPAHGNSGLDSRESKSPCAGCDRRRECRHPAAKLTNHFNYGCDCRTQTVVTRINYSGSPSTAAECNSSSHLRSVSRSIFFRPEWRYSRSYSKHPAAIRALPGG
jgi:hypothetical protein